MMSIRKPALGLFGLVGLGIDSDTTFSYFEAGKYFEPEHLHLHLMMANYLTPKWRGSIETLHSFAMEQYEGHPSSHLAVLPLFAIVEESVYYSIMNQRKEEKNVWQRKDYRSYVESLFQQYLHSKPSNAFVLSPIVFNYFSYVLYKQNQFSLAREAFNGLQNQLTTYPWQYEGIGTIQSLSKILRF